MGRPKKPRDLIALSTAAQRYGVNDSTLRLWLNKGRLRGHGTRPTEISEGALVALLKSDGRPCEPQDDTPAPVTADDPLLTLDQVADILGVRKQTASAYKTEGKLASYRRSDVMAYRAHRAAGDGYTKTGLADARAEGHLLDNEHKRLRNLEAMGKVYHAEDVDRVAVELGRLLANQRQQGAQRLAATLARELGELGIILTSEQRTAIVRAVADVMDAQGDALQRLIAGMASD